MERWQCLVFQGSFLILVPLLVSTTNDQNPVMSPFLSKQSLILAPGNSAASTPTNPDLSDLKGQVTPDPESSSQPAKKAKVTVKAERHLQKRQHPKKASFQKQNGIPKGADSELSTVPSSTKAPTSSKLQGSSQPAEKAEVTVVARRPKVTGIKKKQSPKLQASKKVASLKQNASPKGMNAEIPAGLPLSQTQATQKAENCVHPFGKTQGAKEVKQQLPQKTSKKAAFQNQNGTPKGLKTPSMSSLGSSQPPPAKRRKS